jgi:Na+/proline symporter
MASHGTDQLIVQRLLTCRDVSHSQRALIGSGFVVMVQFALFLLVGLGLWVFFEGQAFERPDEIFALFIVGEMPVGIRGILIAGVFAAAMSSLSSSINSLASASAYDFWAPAAGKRDDEEAVLRAGKLFTLLWAALLVIGAILFIPLSRGTAAVEVALAVASMVYGGLLGAFVLGVFTTRVNQLGATIGMSVGIASVVAVWAVARDVVAWPWFVLIGMTVTVAVGSFFRDPS